LLPLFFTETSILGLTAFIRAIYAANSEDVSMDTLPYYICGIVDKKAVAAFRSDAPAQSVMNEIAHTLAISQAGADFSIFASIQILERKGNNFGRALYASAGKSGEAIQIYLNQKEWQPLYAFLSLACARAVNEFLSRDGSYWPRVMTWKLAEHDDVRNLLTEAGVIK
jgi:hypothetical protein